MINKDKLDVDNGSNKNNSQDKKKHNLDNSNEDGYSCNKSDSNNIQNPVVDKSDSHNNKSDNQTGYTEDMCIQAELDELNNKYKNILSDYELLKNNYDLVNNKLKNIVSHYGKLEQNYNALKQDLQNHKDLQTTSVRIKLIEQIFGLHDKLLLILDNNKDSNNENILLLKMINNEIESIYLDWEVEKYAPSIGELYNANTSKIVSTVSHDNEEMKNKISRVIYMGYKMKNKIIKIAEVEVFA